MSMFPHTVTLYNVEIQRGPNMTETITNRITILRGVFLEASKAVNVRASGLEGADAVNLYIPFDVIAVDGETGEEKKYVGPIAFREAPDRNGVWTMKPGETFFVKGEVVEPEMSFENISRKYDGVYRITKVDEKDFGRLKHWEVGGA